MSVSAQHKDPSDLIEGQEFCNKAIELRKTGLEVPAWKVLLPALGSCIKVSQKACNIATCPVIEQLPVFLRSLCFSAEKSAAASMATRHTARLFACHPFGCLRGIVCEDEV